MLRSGCVLGLLFVCVSCLRCVQHMGEIRTSDVQVQNETKYFTNRTCDEYDLGGHYCFKEIYQEGPKSQVINRGCSCEHCVGEVGKGLRGKDKCKPFGEGCHTFDMKYRPGKYSADQQHQKDLNDFYWMERTYTLCCCKDDNCNSANKHKLSLAIGALVISQIF